MCFFYLTPFFLLLVERGGCRKCLPIQLERTVDRMRRAEKNFQMIVITHGASEQCEGLERYDNLRVAFTATYIPRST
jgi:hypothetical protein